MLKKTIGLFAFILFLAPIATAAPTASFVILGSAPYYTYQPIVFDGQASTNVNGQLGWSTQTYADGKTDAVEWTFGDGANSNPMKLLKGPHTFLNPGTFNVCLTVRDAARASANTCQNITIVDVPAATGGNAVVLTDQGSTAANNSALQTAINNAFAANTVEREIHLPILSDAVTYKSTFDTPAAAGTKFVTIRPISTAFLTRNKRVGPSDAGNMPKLLTPGANASILLMNGSNRKYLRLLGLELKYSGTFNDMIGVGTNHPTTMSGVPDFFFMQQNYLHGQADTNTPRGVLLEACNTASFVDNYFAEFHNVGQEMQAILVLGGTGPHAIINNYLEGYGENVMYGGSVSTLKYSATASSPTTTSCTLSSVTDLQVGWPISFLVGGVRDVRTHSIVRSIAGSVITYDAVSGTPNTTASAVQYGPIPADIDFRRNYLPKQYRYWTGSAAVGVTYSGYHPAVKNSFELKSTMRVVVDGNYFDKHWADAQNGPMLLITPRNPDWTTPWTTIRDIQYTNNRMNHAGALWNILGTDNLDVNGPSGPAQYIVIENNLAEDINGDLYGALSAYTSAVLLMQSPYAFNYPSHVTLTHNTVLNNVAGSRSLYIDHQVTGTQPDFKYVNNISSYLTYGVYVAWSPSSLAVPFPDGFLEYNILSTSGSPSQFSGANFQPNYFPTFANVLFTNAAGGNYRLGASSPYKAGGATPGKDGLDIGINQDAVEAATVNTITGNWSAAAPACTVYHWHQPCS